MKWAVCVFVVCATAAAQPVQVDGEPWSIDLPGFTEMPGAAADKVEQLRGQPQTRKADVRAYSSGSMKLSVMYVELASGGEVSWHQLDEIDRGALESLDEQTNHHTHSTRHERVGDQLVSEVAADAPAGHVEMRSLYGADSADNVHWAMSQCVAPPADTAACRTAVQTLKLVIPNAVAPGEKSRSTEYKVGSLVGKLLLLLIAVAVAIAIFRAERKSRRAKA